MPARPESGRAVIRAAMGAPESVAGRRSGGWARGRGMASLASALMALASGACIAAGPALGVSAPATVRAGQALDSVVTISNVGPVPLVVLPNAVRLRIEGEGARYVPYPGPPLDPWEGARELALGEGTTVAFPDTSDRRGIWKLPPGDFRLVATYVVPQDLVPPLRLVGARPVWRGRIESAPAVMTVLPVR